MKHNSNTYNNQYFKFFRIIWYWNLVKSKPTTIVVPKNLFLPVRNYMYLLNPKLNSAENRN